MGGGFGKLGRIGGLRGPSLPLAIDFGVGSLKVLQVAPGDPLELVAAAQLDTPDELVVDAGGRLRYQMDALPKLVRAGGFKAQRAVCSIPAGQMFCKHLQIQTAEGVSTTTLAAASVAGQIGCDPGALLCRAEEVEGAGSSGRVEVIAFATSREMVKRLMGAVKAARLDLVGIHSELHAMLRAVGHQTDQGRGETATLFLDLGTGSTKATIALGDRMLFARVIEVGSLHFDRAVASKLGCSRAEAFQRRLGAAGASGGAEAVATDVDVAEPTEILIDEVQMCLRYFRSLLPGVGVGKLVFLGGESHQRGLCAEVARAVRLPAQVADPMAVVKRRGKEPSTGVDFGAAQPGWAVPLGLCLSPTDL